MANCVDLLYTWLKHWLYSVCVFVLFLSDRWHVLQWDLILVSSPARLSPVGDAPVAPAHPSNCQVCTQQSHGGGSNEGSMCLSCAHGSLISGGQQPHAGVDPNNLVLTTSSWLKDRVSSHLFTHRFSFFKLRWVFSPHAPLWEDDSGSGPRIQNAITGRYSLRRHLQSRTVSKHKLWHVGCQLSSINGTDMTRREPQDGTSCHHHLWKRKTCFFSSISLHLRDLSFIITLPNIYFVSHIVVCGTSGIKCYCSNKPTSDWVPSSWDRKTKSISSPVPHATAPTLFKKRRVRKTKAGKSGPFWSLMDCSRRARRQINIQEYLWVLFRVVVATATTDGSLWGGGKITELISSLNIGFPLISHSRLRRNAVNQWIIKKQLEADCSEKICILLI